MNEEEALEALVSPLPSVRMGAAEWLAINRSSAAAAEILAAYQMESVPQIRRLLRSASSLTPLSTVATTRSSEDAVETAEILAYLSRLIRHETEPVIGWLRRAAKGELSGHFEASKTNEAIEALRRRIIGLAMLADANRSPVWSSTSLLELVYASAPPEVRECISSEDSASEEDDLIETDPGLLTIVLSNALSNAWDATKATDRAIFVSSHILGDSFNLRISNSFAGTSFSLDDVSTVGASTKYGQRGLGVLAMRAAAGRLQYQLGLHADGGVAHFTLRGKRHHG